MPRLPREPRSGEEPNPNEDDISQASHASASVDGSTLLDKLDAARHGLQVAQEMAAAALDRVSRAQALVSEGRARLIARAQSIDEFFAAASTGRNSITAVALERRLVGVWSSMRELGLTPVADELPCSSRSWLSSSVALSEGWSGRVLVECEASLARMLATRVCGPGVGVSQDHDVLGILASSIAGCIARALGARDAGTVSCASASHPRAMHGRGLPAVEWRYRAHESFLVVSLVCATAGAAALSSPMSPQPLGHD